MRIQTFRNMQGLIYGPDPKRIGCDKAGILRIGYPSGNVTEINISPEAEEVLPALFHNGTGDYPASFTDAEGRVYDLGKVEVRAGRIVAPSQTEVAIMELRCRADAAEAEREELRDRVRELGNIFDTNSLNFLIR